MCVCTTTFYLDILWWYNFIICTFVPSHTEFLWYEIVVYHFLFHIKYSQHQTRKLVVIRHSLPTEFFKSFKIRFKKESNSNRHETIFWWEGNKYRRALLKQIVWYKFNVINTFEKRGLSSVFRSIYKWVFQIHIQYKFTPKRLDSEQT